MNAILRYLDCFEFLNFSSERLDASTTVSESTSKTQKVSSLYPFSRQPSRESLESYPHSLKLTSQPTNKKPNLKIQTVALDDRSKGIITTPIADDNTAPMIPVELHVTAGPYDPHQEINVRRCSLPDLLFSFSKKSMDNSSSSNRSYSGLSDFGASLTEDFITQSPPESP